MNWIDRGDGRSAASGPDRSLMAAALDVCHEALRSGHYVDRKAFLTEHAEQSADCRDTRLPAARLRRWVEENP